MKVILSYTESLGQLGLHKTLSKRKEFGGRIVKGKRTHSNEKRIIKNHALGVGT